MKIAFSNDVVLRYAMSDSSASGGAERAQWLLAKALAATGWAVVVGVRELPPDKEQIIGGVRFVGMETRPRWNPVAGHAANFVWAWSKFLELERPDWCYWRGADALLAGCLLVAKRNGVRGIFSCAFDTDVIPRVALTRRKRLWPL